MKLLTSKIFNKKFLRSLSYLLVVFLIIMISIVVASSVFNIPGGVTVYTVQTGSMAPAIPVGSLIAVKSFEHYNERDVITFKSEAERSAEKPKNTTTHRIVAIEEQDSQAFYKTKGDFNDSPDSTLVDPELVVGKVLLSVPIIGYPVGFAKTQVGFVVLIVIPATIIVYSELINIRNEIKKKLTKKKAAEESKEEIVTPSAE
ncbi:MAG: signal peptidase I [Candidatus Andersenbacteria bacterium]